jgi:hypothetical protein
VDEKDPENRKKWHTQHDALKFAEPPYVYHAVRIYPSSAMGEIANVQLEKNQASLQKAIDAAIANPIDRYIRTSRLNGSGDKD